MRILIVDDSPLVLRSLSRVLVHRGYDVRTRVDQEEAIFQARTWADVALVDVDMPGRTGPELVRAFPPNLPVVFHTGNPEGVPRGARYVQKPATIDEIIQALLDEVAR